jgi:hypothetical protein
MELVRHQCQQRRATSEMEEEQNCKWEHRWIWIVECAASFCVAAAGDAGERHVQPLNCESKEKAKVRRHHVHLVSVTHCIRGLVRLFVERSHLVIGEHADAQALRRK